mgnify:FL=1
MKHVAIYTTPSCVYCQKAKIFFNERDIAFTEYNVATDAVRRQEMLNRSGQMTVPVIDIGSTIVVGFDRLRIKELLGLA